MKLISEIADVSTQGILINENDARALGLNTGRRAAVTDIKTNKSIILDVSVTKTKVNEKYLEISFLSANELNIKEGDEVEVVPAPHPESISFIRKKMDGGRLNRDETAKIITEITENILSPSEISAYITATYINGMNMDEIEYLAREMMASGETISFSKKTVVDKHSIGGVPGNKISLISVPVVAATGLLIPKTSSRAITGAGGTADLMEALAPVTFYASEIKEMTEKVGGVIAWGGATNIVPASNLMIKYENPLKIDARDNMIASIMAIKKAVGSDYCVIDIPVGSGSKITDENEGRALARDLIELGRRLEIKVECAITYGGAPVGRDIGVNLEVSEALRILESGSGSDSLVQKSCAIAGIALEMTGKAMPNTGSNAALKIIKSGKALEKMKEIIEIQGGDRNVTSADLAPGDFSFDIPSSCDGYVISVKNRDLIDIARIAGSPADHGAGLHLHKKPGEHVKRGEPLITIYADNERKLTQAIEAAVIKRPVTVEGILLSRINK